MRIAPFICGRYRERWNYLEFCRRNRLIDLVNLHVFINGQIWITNGRTCRRGGMAGADGELLARAVNRVGVAISPGARHGQVTGRSEFAERSATTIQGDESALGGGDLQQVRADSSQGDGLRWSGAFVGRRHLLKVVVKDCIGDSGSDENGSQGLHGAIFILAKLPDKERLRELAVGNNTLSGVLGVM